MKLTARQRDVLGVIEANGPVTPREIGEYHLLTSVGSAWSACNALERKKYVSAFYGYGGGRSFEITEAGERALAEATAEGDADD
jgi:DNA-binding PadR family transcriptional regulator